MKLKCDEPLSISAFKFNLRRYSSETGCDLSGVAALTIDRAQGRDVDCVVMSLVRANAEHDAGRLLADRRRLNVALTRARAKLVIVGCASSLVGRCRLTYQTHVESART